LFSVERVLAGLIGLTSTSIDLPEEWAWVAVWVAFILAAWVTQHIKKALRLPAKHVSHAAQTQRSATLSSEPKA